MNELIEVLFISWDVNCTGLLMLTVLTINLQQASMNVSWGNFFVHGGTPYTSASYTLSCQILFCQSVTQLLYLKLWKKNYGLLMERSNLHWYTTNIYLWHSDQHDKKEGITFGVLLTYLPILISTYIFSTYIRVNVMPLCALI